MTMILIPNFKIMYQRKKYVGTFIKNKNDVEPFHDRELERP